MRERGRALRSVHASGLAIRTSPLQAKSPRRVGCLLALAWLALWLLGMGELTPALAQAGADCARQDDHDRAIRGCSGAIQRGIDLGVAYTNRGRARLRQRHYPPATGRF